MPGCYIKNEFCCGLILFLVQFSFSFHLHISQTSFYLELTPRCQVWTLVFDPWDFKPFSLIPNKFKIIEIHLNLNLFFQTTHMLVN